NARCATGYSWSEIALGFVSADVAMSDEHGFTALFRRKIFHRDDHGRHHVDEGDRYPHQSAGALLIAERRNVPGPRCVELCAIGNAAAEYEERGQRVTWHRRGEQVQWYRPGR